MMNAAMSAADQKVSTTPTAIHQNMRNALQKDQIYVMPSEDEPHEGTWLQWPHNNGWDRRHVQRYEESWIQMAQALHKGERVHVIVYNTPHMSRVQTLLRRRGLNMSKVDFWIQPTDDVVPVECHMYQCKLRSRPVSICALYNTVSYTTVPITSHSLSLSTLVVIDALPTHDCKTMSFERILVQCFG